VTAAAPDSVAMASNSDLAGTAGTNGTTGTDGAEHDWRVAGEAWGHQAADWACLFEHYSLDVVLALFAGVGVGPGVRLLDIACGSGLTVRLADSLGATTAGIDAGENLVTIARSRTPGADVRLGSMYELPWSDGSFDAVVSVNGIWGGCEAALDEAFRVLRPGGRIGISFWGPGPPLDLRNCFIAFARHSPTDHFASMRRLNDISQPGVADDMLRASGFVSVESGRRTSLIEWPDATLAWRAVSSMGPAVPALRNGDVDALHREVLAAIEPCRDESGIYRFRNDHRFAIATKQ
jgi:SAM-dependent methyltransferase